MRERTTNTSTRALSSSTCWRKGKKKGGPSEEKCHRKAMTMFDRGCAMAEEKKKRGRESLKKKKTRGYAGALLHNASRHQRMSKRKRKKGGKYLFPKEV